MDQKEFVEYLDSFTNGELAFEKLINQKKYFRVNSLKINPKKFKQISKLRCKQSGYWENGFLYNGKEQLGNTWEYFLGYLHPQSLSSMMPALVLDPKEREDVLDMTAAPGNKTTQMSAMMENTGVVVANDLPEKEGALFGNITRLGVLNCLVTDRDAKYFKLRGRFDKVLLDAPCTALGGEKAAHKRYRKEMSERLGRVQKIMILNCFDSLKVGGKMVYSTCTFAKQENEEVIEFLLDKREEAEIDRIKLNIPHEKGLDGMERVLRIYPQHLESEGFFIAKIKKVDQK